MPLLAISILPELDYRQLKSVEKQCRILHVQREYFRQKLSSTKALRDAVSLEPIFRLSWLIPHVAIQCQCCHRKQGFHSVRRERKALDIR